MSPVGVETKETKEKEARMMATMYGDDVHSEWGNAVSANEVDKKEQEKEEEQDEGEGKRKRCRVRNFDSSRRPRLQRGRLSTTLLCLRLLRKAHSSVSQTIVDPNDPNWTNAMDITIPSISISAHSKELFVNTELVIAHGRRYGLVVLTELESQLFSR